jgi:hypothetical protein
MSDRTIISPQYANSLNGLFQGSANLDVGNITANKVTIDSSNAGSDYSLTCYSNTLAISSDASTTANVQIGNPSTYVQLSCPSSNTLQVPQLLLSNSATPVLIKPLSAANYLGLVNPATGTNTASVQGGTFNALTSVTSPLYNISNGAQNVDITLNSQFINIPFNIAANQSFVDAAAFSGGIYTDTYPANVTLPPNGTSAITIVIPWNPYTNWTTDTVTIMPTYISDYPTGTQSLVLVQLSTTQLQITFNTINANVTQPSVIHSINYMAVAQAQSI